jgi:RHS repeat-associated protein
LINTAYSGGTPSVGLTLDRRGRKTQVVDGAGTHAMTYNDAGQLLTESFPNSNTAITNSYDSLLRRWTLASPGGMLTYGYDNASRLNSVSDGTHSATYTYLPNSPLVSNIVLATSGTTKMTTKKNWDNLNRLTAISNQISAGSPISYVYAYNAANQRTQVALADGSYWVYTYDSLGQVTSGQKYWSDGSAVAGQQFGYAFDDIGNRQTATVNGNTGTYTANELNQYTQRTVPGDVWELGTAASNATVTVNLQPTFRHGAYFAEGLSVNNSSSAVYTQLTTVAVLKDGAANSNDVVTTATGHEFMPQTPEVFGYDADGNLTNDGRWAYTWDGENRLIQMQTLANLPSGVPVEKLLFGYDYQGRRVSKVVSNYSNGAWSLVSKLQFVYDGWNLLAELSAFSSPPSPVRSYLWGLDLSGSMQGAGGIGGLLLVSNQSSPVTNSFVAYDGNGNVVALVDATSGSVSAQYEYGPFGEPLRTTGPAAGLNPFRFSTKYTDPETRLLYYGYRYYNPSTGRWLSRDPTEENGGINLYGFIGNNVIDGTDALGLMTHDEVMAVVEQVENSVHNTKCCCSSSALTRLYATMTGTSAGETITSELTITRSGCVRTIIGYYWWDCFAAQLEALWYAPPLLLGGNGWQNFGWYQGGRTNVKTHWGSTNPLLNHFDASHWDFAALVIYTKCDSDGNVHAAVEDVSDMNWTWDPTTASWKK